MPGEQGATSIRGGWIVLSEWRLPGSVAWTRRRFESGEDEAEMYDIRRDQQAIIAIFRYPCY